MLRGMLPMWNWPAAFTGSANTDCALQDPAAGATMRGSQTDGLNHWVTDPITDASPTRSGRSEVTPVKVPTFVMMLTGLPDCICSTPVTCQPSFQRLPLNGSS